MQNKNSWSKLVIFFVLGFSIMIIIQIANSFVDQQILKDLIGRYNFYIIKYLLLIVLGTITFVILSKLIRGKNVKILLVDCSKETKWIQAIIVGGVVPSIILVIAYFCLCQMGYINILECSNEFSVLGGVSIALNVLTTAILEEYGFRSFVFGILFEKYSYKVSAVITSILFALIHMGSDINIVCFINLFLLSYFFIQISVMFNTILAAIVAHFTWNFVHCVILSLRMYGAQYYPHVFEVQISGKYYISGGDYGLESSLIVTFLLCILLVICSVFLRRSKIFYES